MSKDDTAVKDEVVADTTTTAPAPVETESSEVAEVEKDLDDDDTSFEDEIADDDEETEEAPAEPAKPEETKPESQPQTKADKRNEQLDKDIEAEKQKLGLDPNTEIRTKVELRNHLRELNEAKQREAQLGTERGLLSEINPETGEYYTVAEAQKVARETTLEAAQQSAAEERYTLEVQQNQRVISGEAQKALSDFPIFDSNSKDFNPTLAAQADGLLKQSLIFDEAGQLVGSSISPYQLYKTIADSTQANAAQHEAAAQKATEQMLANVDAGGGASQATPTKTDPLLDAFDEEANKY